MDPNEITTALRTDIQSGALPPGTVLKQENLAARFEVSRQPIRRALDRLLASGLLVRRSDRSLAVAGLSMDEARELAEIRVALETKALGLSLPSLTEADLRKARRLNQDLVEEEEPGTLEELDIAFHRLLYSHCGNGRLLRTIEDLRREARRAYDRQPKGSVARATFHAEHEAIVAACAARDRGAAEAALLTHIGHTTARLTSPEDGEA